MKTYKLAPGEARALRRTMIYGTVGTVVAVSILAILGASLGMGEFHMRFGDALLFGYLVLLATMVRAVWKLWEWPGMALWALVVVASLLAGGLGALITLGFYCYVHYSLGRQTGEIVPSKREIFEE